MKYRAYKYRLYPNEEQKVLIAKHLGSCRFIYNYALDKKVRAYQTDKTNLSRFDIQADLPNMKKSEEYCWLKEVNSLSLQASLANLDSVNNRRHIFNFLPKVIHYYSKVKIMQNKPNYAPLF